MSARVFPIKHAELINDQSCTTVCRSSTPKRDHGNSRDDSHPELFSWSFKHSSLRTTTRAAFKAALTDQARAPHAGTQSQWQNRRFAVQVCTLFFLRWIRKSWGVEGETLTQRNCLSSLDLLANQQCNIWTKQRTTDSSVHSVVLCAWMKPLESFMRGFMCCTVCTCMCVCARATPYDIQHAPSTQLCKNTCDIMWYN